MNTSLPTVTSEDEAKAIMSAGLGAAELEFAMSITAPLYWIIREGDKKFLARNGSVFFLNAGEGVFAVTANHVVDGWREDCRSHDVVALQLANLPIDLSGAHSIISSHAAMDIATFRISAAEVKAMGKTVLTGFQTEWPPGPPQQDRGVYFGGYPGAETIWLAPDEVSFGAAPGGGVASSVSELDVSSQIERENLLAVLGKGIPPENFDFGGMSGGPMLTVIETKVIRCWSLAGVIYQGPNPSGDEGMSIPGLEIIRARRAHFIKADGTLDVARWDDLNRR